MFSAQSISVDRGLVSNFHKYETLMKVLRYQLMSFDYFCRWAVFIQFTCWKEKYKVFYENISIPASQRVWSITFQLLWPSTTMSVSILVSKSQIEQLMFEKYSKRSDTDFCDKDREGNTNCYTIPDTKYSITSKISLRVLKNADSVLQQFCVTTIYFRYYLLIDPFVIRQYCHPIFTR